MNIGILQTGHAVDEVLDTLGDYDRLFEILLAGQGFSFTTYSVVDGVFPPGADAAEGWLITGSRHGAYEDHDWIPPLEELIRQIHAAGLPLIGVCFGHQIIAQALGGRVEKFSGGWSVGRTEYEFEGRTLALNAWHQDQVVDLPPDARVIGSSDFCPYAALAIGDTVLTVQPHPEFTADMVAALLQYRGQNLPDAIKTGARDGLGKAVDNDVIARRFGEFLRAGAASEAAA